MTAARRNRVIHFYNSTPPHMEACNAEQLILGEGGMTAFGARPDL